MDDRKKRIDELERDKRECRSSLDNLLDNFGENLYARTKEMQVDYNDEFKDIEQYNICLRKITETNTAIGRVEEKNRRFKELEETIDKLEQEDKERTRGLSALYRKLGKSLLENASHNDFTSLFKEQADALSTKLGSLETRIEELENREGGNVFSWIGKSAQGLVLKSFLSKAQESQEQLFQTIGERFNDRCSFEPKYRDEPVKVERAAVHDLTGEESDLLGDIGRITSVSRTVMEELSVLRDEKRLISAGFGIDGNPQKQIQSLHHYIEQVKEELRVLYRNFGAQTAGIMDAELTPERKYFIDTIVTAEDSEIIGRAVKLNQSITDYERTIDKIKASLSIDEEISKIEKYRRAIDDKKNRITDFERAITELEGNVRDSEARIKEFEKRI
ncbi:MAG: hypothetical protein LBH16_10120 [Treponema sp.]|jgi:prefoldin subunit 5|nr:hypothetical protein [Treponema sp.]